MACFALGVALVVVLSLWDQITARRLILVAVLGLIGTLMFAYAAKSIFKRFGERANNASQGTRIALNRSSRAMIADYPLLGTGWNTYGVMINPPYHYGDPIEEWERTYGVMLDPSGLQLRTISESWYYLMLAETGFAGTTAMFLFMFSTLFWCGRVILRYRRTFLAAAAIGLFVGVGMNYLQSNLERVLTQPKNLAAWMICLGIMARMEWWRRQGRSAASLKAGAPWVNPQPAPLSRKK